jgi:arabinofuranan 3-O-arabinosyltransferase
LAAVAFVPLFWSSPGQVSADNKSYLYLDPSRFLAKAPYLWDPTIGLGTVTHQTIGFLWPLGPYYWLADRVGLPMWVAQRLWLGALLFAAGAGVVFLSRTWGHRRVTAAVTVAAFAYLLSPYALDYAARISVILMPWAALPWLVGFIARSLRGPTWRWPALFALTVLTAGGVNATALLLAGLGPALWVPWAIWGARETTLRRAVAGVGRIGVLTLAVSVWWITGLVIEGHYGIDILDYTETYAAVARTASPGEVLRGLGYWFFYGGDKVDRWVGPAGPYLTGLWLVVIGYGLVALALTALAVVRFRHRGFVAGLLTVGVVVSVGAYPLAHPSLYGRLFNVFVGTTAGQAMRSTPRAVPLVALALALALGAGAGAATAAVRGRWPRYAFVAPAACLALLALDMPPLFTGGEYSAGILRDENVPAYWDQAASAIDAGSHDTRVYEVPGSDFASYRWGGTVDPITPGLVDRPYVARELVPWGSAPGADLVNAFEEQLQDGVFEPSTLAPFARLISAATLSLRNDLQYERYRTPAPQPFWQQVLHAGGLAAPVAIGPATPNTPIARLPMLDETALSTPPGTPDPPAVATIAVPGAPAIVHAEPVAHPLVVDGDGEGLVDAGAAGLLSDDAVLSSAALRPEQLDQALADGADLMVTDTNRAQARRWGSVRENVGYTEQAGEQPLVDDPTDNRLDVFPGAGSNAATVTQQRGVDSVQATAYGNPVTYTPEDRAANALDGDPLTAWRVGAFSPVEGERLVTTLAAPVTADHLTLLQPITGPRNRWLTRVRLRFDGGPPLDVDLDDSSRSQPGQRIDFGTRTFRSLSLEVRGDNVGKVPSYAGLTSVGVAELTIGDGPPHVDEVVRLPEDLLAAAGARSADHRLTLLLTRQRADQHEPIRSDPELSISRTFSLPTARTFTVSGTARISGVAPDAAVDAALGAPSGETTATASDRLPGEPSMRASAALDGDPTTAWQTPIGVVTGQALTVRASAPVTFDHLDLSVFADGRHSVPTQLTLSADGGAPVAVSVPPISDDPSPENAAVAVRVPLPAPVTASSVVVGIAAIRPETTIDYISERPVDLPVAIAELGVPGWRVAPPIGALPGTCRSDLVSVDGQPVPVRVTGTVAHASARQPLTVTACGAPLVLGPGAHDVRTAIGRDLGIDVDRLVLDSAPPTASSAAPSPPTVTIAGQTRVSYDLRVDRATQPFWLVLGQSLNAGWHARLDGHDLGPATLIDGYANGWRITPPAGGAPLVISLEWTPQRWVWWALGVSAVATVICLVLVVLDRRPDSEPPDDERRRDRGRRPPVPVVVAFALGAGVLFGAVGGIAVGLVAAATALGGLLLPRRGRRLLGLVPAALLALAAAYIVAKSLRYPIPGDPDWPAAFSATDVLAWAAVAVTVTLVAVQAVRGAAAQSPVNGFTTPDRRKSWVGRRGSGRTVPREGVSARNDN